MQTRSSILSKVTLLCFLALWLAKNACAADAKADPTAGYASSGAIQNGNHITLNTDAFLLKPVNGVANQAADKCAPAGSELTYIRSTQNQVFVYFRSVPAAPSPADAAKAENAGRCAASSYVITRTTYIVDAAEFDKWYFHANGVVFGALVVPFKFRLGGSSELVSSATVAPYIGWNFDNITHGLSFSPVLSAGLALVPVVDQSAKTTTSRSAFSVAAGLVLTSSKNSDFHAGLLIGKDYLSRSDRALDPNVSKAWISLYLGYKL